MHGIDCDTKFYFYLLFSGYPHEGNKNSQVYPEFPVQSSC